MNKQLRKIEISQAFHNDGDGIWRRLGEAAAVLKQR